MAVAAVSGDGFSSNWYRVAALRPRLRSHAAMHRHTYRGKVWYVLQDQQTGRHFRLSPSANMLLCLMDGQRTTEQIWQAASDRLGAERPTRADTLRLLVQLHQGDLLHAGLPELAELDRRAERDRRSRMLVWLRNPMAVRFPLLDPDRALEGVAPVLRAIPGWFAALAWFALIAAGLVLAALHWPELSANVSDRVLTTQNLVMLMLLYPASKILHELGHACAIKLGGGEVHEVGIMLLILVPVPYVEGSASSAFRDRRVRMLAAAAGVMVELALAAIAVCCWVGLSPGLLRAAMFNIALLCSVSTLLFNANPLLRFDGYYVLCDLLEIPNLDLRARKYLLYLLQHRLFGDETVRNPVQAPGERFWFVAYGLTSFFYRLAVMVGIVVLVSAKLFVLGTLLAVFATVQMFVLPLARGARYLFTGRQLQHNRRRAAWIVGGALATAAAFLFVLPLPYGALASGVVWVPEQAIVRAGADGFVQGLLAAPDTDVAAGAPLFALQDPAAAAQLEVYRADLQVAEGRFQEANLIDRNRARLASDQVDRARATLARAEQRRQDLQATALQAGIFIVPDAARLPGRFVHKGDLLGYVIAPGDREVRVVVPQAEIDLVRSRTRAVQVRSAEQLADTVPAVIAREMPSALDHAPAPGLSSEGGGPMVADPSSSGRDRPLGQFFEVVLHPLGALLSERVGEHAFARFDLGWQPVGWRILRQVRQVTLRMIND
jgi:putative peptide zinc metalloprotease protein